MQEYLTPDAAKRALAYDQARLAQIEADEPAGGLDRWGWLCVRRNLVGDLTDRAGALIEAWDSVGDEAAATAVEELGEHYAHLYKQADDTLEAARRELATDAEIDL